MDLYKELRCKAAQKRDKITQRARTDYRGWRRVLLLTVYQLERRKPARNAGYWLSSVAKPNSPKKAAHSLGQDQIGSPLIPERWPFDEA